MALKSSLFKFKKNNSIGIHVIKTLSSQASARETIEKKSKTTHFGFETAIEEDKLKKG